MPSADTQLSLVVPFYQDNTTLKPLLAELCKQPGEQRFSYFQKLLSRADKKPVKHTNTDLLLCELLGIDVSAGIPYAALTWLADKGSHPEESILRCDPVHLYPDMEYVLLFDSTEEEVSHNEATELTRTLNEFLSEDGWRIEQGSPTRWYLHGADVEKTTFTPLNEVRGENILPHYPEGKYQAKWRQVLTEVQMLLHAHPVNDERESQGLRPVNGIWPWGAGKIIKVANPAVSMCYGESVLLKGLSDAHQVGYTSNVDTFEPDKNSLVLLPVLADYSIEGISAYLDSLEQSWLKPVTKMLQKGGLQFCDIYLGNVGHYRLTAKTLRRWWRRNRPVPDLLAAS